MKKERHTKQERHTLCRHNWFDRILLFLLVGGIVTSFFAVRFLLEREEREHGEVVYTVWMKGVELDLYTDDLPIFREGDRIRSQNGTVELGRVTSVERRAHRVTVVEEGMLSFAEIPERADYLITVVADARRKSGEGIRVGDIRIAAGSELTLRIGDFLSSSATVTRVDWRGTADAESA